MNFARLYGEIKKIYSLSPEASEYFSLRTLVSEIWYKYGFSPTEHILHPEKSVSDAEKILCDVKKAVDGYPLQYIVGKTEFMNCEFYVGEGVLIPRSDTEISVEKALECLEKGGIVYDICCGSGCIGISVLKESDAKKCYSFDISPQAIDYTLKNAALNGVSERIEVISYDVMSGNVPKNLPVADVIISNPPYVRSNEMESLPQNVRFEPSIALDGGEDGADFYRKILEDFTPMLKDGGYMVFEIAPFQSEILRNLFERHGYVGEIFKDYRGNFRTACGKKEKNY